MRMSTTFSISAALLLVLDLLLLMISGGDRIEGVAAYTAVPRRIRLPFSRPSQSSATTATQTSLYASSAAPQKATDITPERVNGMKHQTAPNQTKHATDSFADIDEDSTRPRHVAFVCDGNSRWARARGLPAVMGHAAGADRLVEVLRFLQTDCPAVTHCTFYGFSTENWKRPANEIRDIWRVMEQTVRRFGDQLLQENNVVVQVVGDLDDKRIPVSLRRALHELEQETRDNKQRRAGNQNDNNKDSNNVLTICLAINYGGRQDIVTATKRLAKLIADGVLDSDAVTEETLASCLCTSGIPDPDLIIRTSGETRLSNFLLWNAAYSELYFTNELWPDFGTDSVHTALDWFAQRKRRFGGRTNDDERARTQQ